MPEEPDIGKAPSEEIKDLESKRKNIQESILLLSNIIEGGQVRRFQFTKKEQEALKMTLSLLQANLELIDEVE